jgi:hypothetical protein
MSGHNHRLAPAEPIPGSKVAGVSALLQQLLDHAQGNPETMGNLSAGAFLMVIGSKDSFTKIQR